MRFLIILLLTLVLTNVTVGEEVLLIETRNDINERDDRLYLELDEKGNPVELVHRVYDIVMGVYRLEELNRGISLRQYRGKTVLGLKIEDFESDTGGDATLTYLKSIVPTPQYGSMEFQLRKHLGKWRLFRIGDDRPLKRLFFQAGFSRVLGILKPTGIKQIRTLRDRK